MNKRVICGVFLGILGVVSSYAKQEKMNVIYIMSDDHCTQAIGAYGSRLAKLNPTPVIDSLAADGVRFDNNYVTNSICTPSRACIITGQYSHNNGARVLSDALDADKQYLPKEFKKMGYQTAVIGKWHLHVEPVSFDYYCVLDGYGGQGAYFNPSFLSNEVEGKKWPNNKLNFKGYSTDVITNISLDWLKTKRDKTKPFLLLHQYKAPHDMFEFAPRYKYYLEEDEIPLPKSLLDTKDWGSVATRGENDSLRHKIGTSISTRHTKRNYVDLFNIEKTGDDQKDTYLAYQEYLKMYLRCVKGVDDNLKRLFDYLKKEGLWDNTIIVYTGDQGMMLGEHDLQDKRWMYEESQRMPLIIRDPSSKERGVAVDLLTNNIDFAPTLIEMVGGKAPDYMDGKSFASVFEGKTPDNWRDAVYYRYWKHLTHHDVPAHLGIRTKDYKLILFYGMHYKPEEHGKPSMVWLKDKSNLVEPTPVAFELYDLNKDPLEMKNVAEDPAYAQVLKQMKEKLKALRIEVGDTDEQFPPLKKVIEEAFE